MRLIAILLCFVSVYLNSIEISLEENRAEIGTVGYVDIKKIYDRFSSEIRKKLDDEIKKRQDEIDLMKKELFHLKSVKERLMWEYEVAKMYEDFSSKIKGDKGETPTGVISTSTVLNSTDFSNKALQQLRNENLNQSEKANISERKEEINQPYIVMPGVGNIPISVFKFSFSSSTVVIEDEIKNVEKRIQNVEKKISELKEKYDSEISREMEKENIGVFKKIYSAIEEVAKEEGISIVIDKRNILFGVKSIDLTQKTIQKIELEK